MLWGFLPVNVVSFLSFPQMVVDSSLIDFGTHVVGETISRVITLTNMGALGTRYSLAPLFTNCLQLHNPLQHSSPSEQVTCTISHQNKHINLTFVQWHRCVKIYLIIIIWIIIISGTWWQQQCGRCCFMSWWNNSTRDRKH